MATNALCIAIGVETYKVAAVWVFVAAGTGCNLVALHWAHQRERKRVETKKPIPNGSAESCGEFPMANGDDRR